jgi:hypothetical protein
MSWSRIIFEAAYPLFRTKTTASRIRYYSVHNLPGANFRGQHARILCARIPHGTQNPCFGNSCFAKFLEEGAAFLCSGNSGKPVARLVSHLLRERFPKYQFSGIDHAIGAQDSRQFMKDLFPLGIQVEDAINQGNFN